VIATLEKPVGIELPQFSLLRSTRLIIGRAHLRTMTNPPGHPRLCYAGALCNQAAPRIYEGSDPNGIRTRVTAVKGRCPGPLDDRVAKAGQYRIEFTTRKANWQRDLACIVPEAGGAPAATDHSQPRSTTSCAVRTVAPRCCPKTPSALCTSDRRASSSRRSFSTVRSSSSTLRT
jgi:hypothetical protein